MDMLKMSYSQGNVHLNTTLDTKIQLQNKKLSELTSYA